MGEEFFFTLLCFPLLRGAEEGIGHVGRDGQEEEEGQQPGHLSPSPNLLSSWSSFCRYFSSSCGGTGEASTGAFLPFPAQERRRKATSPPPPRRAAKGPSQAVRLNPVLVGADSTASP